VLSYGGGGGGATYVQNNENMLLILAGGGGGAGAGDCGAGCYCIPGGLGGSPVGGNGPVLPSCMSYTSAATGGTQSDGGTGATDTYASTMGSSGVGSRGIAMTGGSGVSGGGGGGAGYYGGGGGANAASNVRSGGGGSSYLGGCDLNTGITVAGSKGSKLNIS
jgi:hypothetical protein